MNQYKYKLKEAPEETTAKGGKKFKVGNTQISKGIKYTVTDIDKETGKISWKVDYLPNLSQLFDSSSDLVNIAKTVYQKAKNDPKFRDIYEDARDLKNKIRTHVRNEYPEDYIRITSRTMDENLDEISTTGGGAGVASFTPGTGGQYATPYAFRRKGKKADDKAYKEIGYKSVNEEMENFYVTVNRGHGDGKFLVKSSESEYTKPRVFSRDEAKAYVKNAEKGGGTPGRQYAYWVSDINMDRIDENITENVSETEYFSYLNDLRDSGKTNMFGAGEYLERAFNIDKSEARKILAAWMKSLSENKDPGASLGPGPKAGPDGVKNSAYTNQFKYKLVPKKIKGSGIIVKQIFEEEGKKNFQKKRIDAFDGIEEKLNNIYTMISNAKNETVEYYKDNPESYLVVKPTDLISDYLEDIEKLLKGE